MKFYKNGPEKVKKMEEKSRTRRLRQSGVAKQRISAHFALSEENGGFN
jgi:hypothetical protein